MPLSPPTVFAPGSTAVRRDVLNGGIWTAAPLRVVQDDGAELVLCCWPGTGTLASTSWIEWLLNRDEAVRKRAIPILASGRWDLGRWDWRWTTLLARCGAGDYFSILQYFDGGGEGSDGGDGARSGGWYVNFELPYRRTAIGIDTFDLFLDLVVEPDLSGYTWKDEDEYAHARRLGLIDDALHARVDEARGQVIALIETGSGPFAQDWSAWRRDPAWPTPELPADALSVPVSALD